MGLGTLVARVLGETQLPEFWNQFRSALMGDFVGRDTSGIPIAGNNLGNSLYPWGIVYSNQAVIGGVALNSASLERPAYQIVSGKVRSGSNQPIFLRPAGSALTFSLFATSTNLVLSIAGTAATWLTDKTGITTIGAPASNNTCTVNDSTASSQNATRTWGEYGSGTPYYAINVTSMGSSISARVGSYQAFKLGNEYFLAFVEGTTSLNRAFRGFFFDSTDAPIPRQTIANGATITLMNLGFVFVDSDLSTVDTIFVGAGVNNAPTWAYTSPSSPLAGDYWFDQTNQVWKRYNSGWAQVNRILVGMVVSDATHCVAARCLDFFGLCRSDNTIELAVDSNTVVKATGALSRVNVNGKRIDFGLTRPVWDTASNLAASAERYNAGAIQANVKEYFYVTDQGQTEISDMQPYWRADLLGWYHPYNPWRSVGYDTPDGSAHFATGQCFNTPKILIARPELPSIGQQVGSSSSTFNTNSTSFTDVTNVTLSITTGGRPVLLNLQNDGSGNPSDFGVASTAQPFIRLLRDGNEIAQWTFETLAMIPLSLTFVDYLAPLGTHTYKIQMKTSDAGVPVYMKYAALVAFEL